MADLESLKVVSSRYVNVTNFLKDYITSRDRLSTFSSLFGEIEGAILGLLDTDNTHITDVERLLCDLLILIKRKKMNSRHLNT